MGRQRRILKGLLLILGGVFLLWNIGFILLHVMFANPLNCLPFAYWQLFTDGSKSYHRVLTSVYYVGSEGDTMACWKIEAVDAASFQVLMPQEQSAYWKKYARDKNYVYTGGKRLYGADVHTFLSLNSWYAKDKERVYFIGTPIVSADPLTFRAVDDTVYGKDKVAAYDSGVVISGVDPVTFVNVSGKIVKDKNSVYYVLTDHPEVIPGADPESFVVLDGLYSKDRLHVYYATSLVDGADQDSFLAFPLSASPFDAKDRNHVYNAGRIMQGVKPDTVANPPKR